MEFTWRIVHPCSVFDGYDNGERKEGADRFSTGMVEASEVEQARFLEEAAQGIFAGDQTRVFQ